MEKVRLEPAYFWSCPTCGVGQFELVQTWEGTDEEKENILRTILDLEDWEEIPEMEDDNGLVEAPSKVTCKSCSSKFDVYFDSSYDNDDHDDLDDDLDDDFYHKDNDE
jgi:hypothetical protein